MRGISKHVLVLAAAFAVTGTSYAQNNAAPCKPGSSGSQQGSGKDKSANAPCAQPADKEPSAAEKFPFPGEPVQAIPAKPPQDAPSAPAAPDAPASEGKEPPAADKFPFPGSAPPMPGSEDSSSSSSSSSSSDDAPDRTAPDNKDTTEEKPRTTVRRRLPKVEKLQSDEERAAEDMKIAKFYEDAGKLTAAYSRAKDAVKYLPEDPYTHFALANIAQKLEKKDEAIAEYNTYLKLDPDGLQVKKAEKALSQLR